MYWFLSRTPLYAAVAVAAAIALACTGVSRGAHSKTDQLLGQVMPDMPDEIRYIHCERECLIHSTKGTVVLAAPQNLKLPAGLKWKIFHAHAVHRWYNDHPLVIQTDGSFEKINLIESIPKFEKLMAYVVANYRTDGKPLNSPEIISRWSTE